MKFKEVLKMKQDEISKIEEKNERIQSILGELEVFFGLGLIIRLTKRCGTPI